jgi:transcriptional regulator with XRE-family HTH domain
MEKGVYYQRIKELMAAKNIPSDRQFCLLIGMHRTSLNNLPRIKTGIGATMLEKISNTWPDVNINYLVTGNGSLIKDMRAQQYEILQERLKLLQQETDVYKAKSQFLETLLNPKTTREE